MTNPEWALAPPINHPCELCDVWPMCVCPPPVRQSLPMAEPASLPTSNTLCHRSAIFCVPPRMRGALPSNQPPLPPFHRPPPPRHAVLPGPLHAPPPAARRSPAAPTPSATARHTQWLAAQPPTTLAHHPDPGAQHHRSAHEHEASLFRNASIPLGGDPRRQVTGVSVREGVP